jgi:hypothetical protein
MGGQGDGDVASATVIEAIRAFDIAENDPGHLTAILGAAVRAANLKTTADGDVMAVDWAFACTGAPWVDAALLVPRLIDAGHSPDTAERLMSRLPAWRTAPVASVTALAALWTMFREYKATYGPEDVRAFRRQAARAGRRWVEYRMR